MQRQVLDYLYAQGELVLAVFPGISAPVEALKKFALALNAGASFVLFDFSSRGESNTGIPLDDLFCKTLSNDELEKLEKTKESGLVFAGSGELDISEDSFRTFYHNLLLIKKLVPHALAKIPDDPTRIDAKLLAISKIIIVDSPHTDESAALVEDCKDMHGKNILWLTQEWPDKKRFPKCAKAIKRSASKDIRKILGKNTKKDEASPLVLQQSPDPIAENMEWLIKGEILKKNPMEGIPRLFRNFFPILLLLVFLVPFIYPNSIEASHSNMRDRIPERNKLSVAPSFDYTFDGNENLRRIARYAIGRFNAVITDDQMIRDYLNETITENGYKGLGWESNMFAIPPQGTVFKFSRPENIQRAAADSIGAAWKYWTSILSDSIAYITEFYHKYATPTQRKHNGIDLASRKGARILAPFSAKAYTSRDERGGIIIGLVREKDVMLFMHCDQLLYLDGQEVMQGDPIATVGMTGHSTGPHAHIVTGIIDKRGNKRIGNVKYKVIDPIAWYYKFKPKAP